MKAIKRVEEIKEKRQAQFIKNRYVVDRHSVALQLWQHNYRLKAGLKLHEEAEKKEVEQSIYLLEDPEGAFFGLFVGYSGTICC